LKNLLDLWLALASAVFYLVAILLEGLGAVGRSERLKRLAAVITVVGLIAHTGALVARGVLSGDFPLADLFEYTLFMSWAMVLAYLGVFRRRLPQAVGTAVLAVVFLLLGSSLLLHDDAAGAKMPALRSYWLYIHVSLAALGETFFAVGFVASLLLLAKRRSADSSGLAALDDLAYRAVAIGFPLFTAGALVAGAIWAKQAWGAYWSWDPKEVMSLVVWLVYAAYLHARLVRDMRGSVAAALSVAGFLLTLFTIFSTLIFGGLHSYG
jgi:ABC-type transport system involved in cytochrome c biogenesis permease subunit